MSAEPHARGPLAELRAFLEAALVTKVPRDQRESTVQRRRRRAVVGVTLVVGASVLWLALRVPPGDPRFYLYTLALAGVWLVGALASGPLHLGHAHTRGGTAYARPVVQSLALGTLLLVTFLVGALLVDRVPFLREPVDGLLDHAREGSLVLIVLITAINGMCEEMFFRGALYAAINERWTVPATTVLYALSTAGSGVLLLSGAALVIGLVTALQRRVTGGVLGPIITHLTWSVGMLLLLPPLLDLLR